MKTPFDVIDPLTGEHFSTEVLLEILSEEGYVIVPIKPTDKMLDEFARIGDGPGISGEECWGYMLAAALASNAT